WLPSAGLGGVAPSSCPSTLKASLTVNTPVSADGLTTFAVPVTGVGLSAVVPSTPELDFGSEALGEGSAPQALTLTNQGTAPVQILPALNSRCVNPAGGGVLTLQRPPSPGTVAGVEVDTGNILPNGSTINYNCDSDLTSQLANFQISNDNCSGTLLLPMDFCT